MSQDDIKDELGQLQDSSQCDKVVALKGQELRKSALQGCKAYGLGSQRTVPRIGYEIKDRNSGRVLCKDVKLTD